MSSRQRRFAEPDAITSKWEVTTYDEIEEAPFKDWLIKPLLAHNELSVWYGGPGCGKSVLMGDLAAHVASGLPWFGRKVRLPGVVIYLAAERADLVKRRLAAWRKRHGVLGLPLAVLSGTFDLGRPDGDADALRSAIIHIEAMFETHIALIIVDTLAQVLGGEDENGTGMAALVANCSYLRTKTGAHVAIVHHTPVFDPERLRGRGDLLGAVDNSYLVRKDGDGLREVVAKKVNDGPEGIGFAYGLEGVLLGYDDDGDAIEAPVVVPSLARPVVAQGRRKRGPRMAPSERIALDQLERLTRGNGQVAPPEPQIPADVLVVDEATWRNACYSAAITSGEDPSAKRKAFGRAAGSLVARCFVGKWGDWVWVRSASAGGTQRDIAGQMSPSVPRPERQVSGTGQDIPL